MSGTPNELGQPGVDEPVAQIIRRYFPTYPDGQLRQLMSDPSTALLAALVQQGIEDDDQAADFEMEPSSVTASYFAEELTVTTTGPEIGGEEPEFVDGKKIELGDVYQSFDLRFTDDIVVAFKGPNEPHRQITYRAKDSPVVGKQATTDAVWVQRADSATSDPTLHIEGDSE